jgi:hypothetical protein
MGIVAGDILLLYGYFAATRIKTKINENSYLYPRLQNQPI